MFATRRYRWVHVPTGATGTSVTDESVSDRDFSELLRRWNYLGSLTGPTLWVYAEVV